MKQKPIEPKFQRRTENFICENCGTFIMGNGYTNHCPKCLYSKHVDINPGDRAHHCGGLMKPMEVQKLGDEFYITHKCSICGFQKKNRINKNDDFNEVIKISNSKLL